MLCYTMYMHVCVCVCVHNLGSAGCLESVEWNTGMEYWDGINLQYYT